MLVGRINLAVFVCVFVLYHSGLRINAFGSIAPEPRKRLARSHPDDIFAKSLRRDGIVIHLLERKLLQLIPVHGNVEIGIPFETVLVQVHGRDREFKSPVAHLALIASDA